MAFVIAIDVKTDQQLDRLDFVLTITLGVFIKSKWYYFLIPLVQSFKKTPDFVSGATTKINNCNSQL